MSQGKIVKVSGPLVVASGMSDADMFDVVRVGEQGLWMSNLLLQKIL